MSLSPEEIRSRDRLVRRRAFVKGQLTAFRRVLETPETPPDIDTVKIYMERLEKYFEPLAELTAELAELEPEAGHTEEQLEMEAEYIRLLAKGRKCDREVSSFGPSTANAAEPVRESPSPFNVTHSFTRLPEQGLPKFDGKYENWLSFKDDFESSIGSRVDLSNTQKLKYLRSCLSDEPERLVRSFGTTNEGYPEAMKLLKETFEQKGKILERHINAIFNIPTMQRESATELCALINTTQLHLSALRSLEQPVDQWGSMLVFIILNKLDKTTRREWKRAQRGNEVPSFEKLIHFLRETVIASDDAPSGNTGKEEKANNTTKGKQGRGADPVGKGPTRTQCFVAATGANCPACNGSSHPILRCQQFKTLSPKERHGIAVKATLCLNCLRPNHNTKDCGSNYSCLVCKRKHHTWLHFAEPLNTPVAVSEGNQA
ncbi:uncharacterized protein [Venturia canescens]|uniref:uncharacterized protein n=1 Tax=Venturia canescens TaxID=32260 RepID=UPI001C9D2181|nr:uncharacterized protein LOC122415220 [Venturia canescens]